MPLKQPVSDCAVAASARGRRRAAGKRFRCSGAAGSVHSWHLAGEPRQMWLSGDASAELGRTVESCYTDSFAPLSVSFYPARP
jgi:hypothetical protein